MQFRRPHQVMTAAVAAAEAAAALANFLQRLAASQKREGREREKEGEIAKGLPTTMHLPNTAESF